MRIYWVAASKSVMIGINLFDITAQHHSVARRCFPSSTALSGDVFENYGEVEFVWGSVSGLARGFVVVTF